MLSFIRVSNSPRNRVGFCFLRYLYTKTTKTVFSNNNCQLSYCSNTCNSLSVELKKVVIAYTFDRVNSGTKQIY